MAADCVLLGQVNYEDWTLLYFVLRQWRFRRSVQGMCLWREVKI